MKMSAIRPPYVLSPCTWISIFDSCGSGESGKFRYVDYEVMDVLITFQPLQAS